MRIGSGDVASEQKYPQARTSPERKRTPTKYIYLYIKALKHAIPVPRVSIRQKGMRQRTTRNKNRIAPLPTTHYRIDITHKSKGSKQTRAAVMTTSRSESQPNQQISSQLTYHPTLRGRKEDDVPSTTQTIYHEEPLLREQRKEDIAYTFTTQQTYPKESAGKDLDFGTDSFQIKVDNCASRTMSFQKSDFIPGTLMKVRDKVVRGFGNTISRITHVGTIKWKIYDDDGRIHDIIIPNSYYVPTGKSRLLSPQHWSQKVNDHHPHPKGT
jgi:hypothetical protein